MTKIKKEKSLQAFKTDEGLIEISSIDELDMIVGGAYNPSDIFCEIVDSESLEKSNSQILGC
jgi:hypothetical protein